MHDSTTGETFFMGWQKCNIYVELQGIDVKNDIHEPSSAAERALATSIPNLAYCATWKPPPQQYEIDNNAMRVSTYL